MHFPPDPLVTAATTGAPRIADISASDTNAHALGRGDVLGGVVPAAAAAATERRVRTSAHVDAGFSFALFESTVMSSCLTVPSGSRNAPSRNRGVDQDTEVVASVVGGPMMASNCAFVLPGCTRHHLASQASTAFSDMRDPPPAPEHPAINANQTTPSSVLFM